MTYDKGNSGPGMGQVQNVTGLDQLMGSQTSPFGVFLTLFLTGSVKGLLIRYVIL